MGGENVQDAFRKAVQTELDALYRTACRMLFDRVEAEDAVQETLHKAWRNLHRFTPGAEMRPWLFRILNNTCLDHLRARARRKNVPFDAETADMLGLESEERRPDEFAANLQLGRRIEAEMAKLSADHRAVVQLVIVEQFSYEEAAQTLDIPVGTLRSRLSRARASLCAGLADYLHSEGQPEPGRTPARLRLVK
ncbi:MAG: RNA polymerase sigma factor [Pseudomonadota bacterium]